MPWTFAKREGLLIVAGIVKVVQLTCLLWIYSGHGTIPLRGSNTWNTTEKLLERLSHLQIKKQHQRFFFWSLFLPLLQLQQHSSLVSNHMWPLLVKEPLILFLPQTVSPRHHWKRKLHVHISQFLWMQQNHQRKKKELPCIFFNVNEMHGCKKEQPNCNHFGYWCSTMPIIH